MLGDLSAKYESSGDPANISDGWGDAGGKSYGCYQFASNMGIPQAFVEWLQLHEAPFNEYGNQLGQYEVGSDEFDQKWRELGTIDSVGFTNVQHEYVQAVYYDRAVQLLIDNYGFDINSRSEALQQVLWSRSVQYSAGNMPELFQSACELAGQTLETIDDHNLIYYIYEVNLTDPSWTSGSPALRPGLFSRFNNERQEALEMLGDATN